MISTTVNFYDDSSLLLLIISLLLLLIRWLVLVLLFLLLIVVMYIGYYRIRCYQQRRITKKKNEKIIAFFHPYCSSGGGGERVLWKMIEVLSKLGTKYSNNTKVTTSTTNTPTTKTNNNNNPIRLKVVIYTIDPSPPDDNDNNNKYQENLLQKVQERFDVHIATNDNMTTTTTTTSTSTTKNSSNTNIQFTIQFIHLSDYKYLLEPSPYFSLLMESIGSMQLAWYGLMESLKQNAVPDLYIDTMGCAFTYLPAAVVFGCIVMPYVHYPTISTDMLQLVWERRPAGTYNHNITISQSIVKTYVKLIYYIIFAILYGCIGSFCCTIVLVNSTWTYNHIINLWRGLKKKHIQIVYPPCNVHDLIQESTSDQQKKQPIKRIPAIISIGQFRPEKDHILQLQSVAKLYELYPSYYKNESNKIQLILIGSCRGKDDEERLQSLRNLAKELNIDTSVQFIVNQPYPILRNWLLQGTIGIHTMWNEHFGIGIVEMMAAGLITIAHNSGGPKLDIIQPSKTGYLATTVTEYAETIHTIFQLSEIAKQQIQRDAQQSVQRFSDQVFAESFERIIVLDLQFLK